MTPKPDQTCPNCGAETFTSRGNNTPDWMQWVCHSGRHQQSALCREREEHRKTKENLAELKETLTKYQNGFQGSCYTCEPVGILNQKLEAENARLRSIAERAIETLAEKGRSFTAMQLQSELEQITKTTK